MSKALPIDSNSRPIPGLNVGFGQTFAAGLVSTEFSGNIVRFKAIGDTVFRLASQPNSQVIINDGETEYFFIPKEEQLQIISGSLNLMI
jgi:hypothetical protein